MDFCEYEPDIGELVELADSPEIWSGLWGCLSSCSVHPGFTQTYFGLSEDLRQFSTHIVIHDNALRGFQGSRGDALLMSLLESKLPEAVRADWRLSLKLGPHEAPKVDALVAYLEARALVHDPVKFSTTGSATPIPAPRPQAGKQKPVSAFYSAPADDLDDAFLKDEDDEDDVFEDPTLCLAALKPRSNHPPPTCPRCSLPHTLAQCPT